MLPISSLLKEGSMPANLNNATCAELHTTISELKKLLNIRTSLLTILTHDIRGPIVNLSMYLQRTEPLPNIEGDVLQMIKENLQQRLKAMEEVLEWTVTEKKHGFRKELIRISDLLCHQIELKKPQATEKDIRIVFCGDSSFIAYSSSSAIILAIRNLLDNAIKFSPPSETILLSCTRLGKHCKISVSNSGFIEDFQKKQIESGEAIKSYAGTFDERGFGIGLLLCKEKIASIGSDLRINNLPNNRLEFYFLLKFI